MKLQLTRVFTAFLAMASAVATFAAAAPSATPEQPVDQDHEREESGVNPYTAPEVEEIFRQLDDVKPLPFDQLKRDFPQAFPGPREQLGLIFGSLIADGFLIVACEKKDRVEDLGRVLLRQAKSLGVGENVIRHSASLTELGKRGDWPAMRRELNDTQTDVEKAMIDMKDQKLAHLVSLGGWLRGLEISSGAVQLDYSPERARGLWQVDLIHYYSEELSTLPPAISGDPLFQKVRAGVDAIRDILDKAQPDNITADEVKALHENAHQVNLAIAHND